MERPKAKEKLENNQKKSLKGWKPQFFQQFGRSRPKQRNS
jgi:hypothetical protein